MQLRNQSVGAVQIGAGDVEVRAGNQPGINMHV